MKSCDDSPIANRHRESGRAALPRRLAERQLGPTGFIESLLNVKSRIVTMNRRGDGSSPQIRWGRAAPTPRFMGSILTGFARGWFGLGILVLVVCGNVLRANPTGGTVTRGAATFSSSGSQFTINQTSANAFINWQTFNIAAGETTTFNQPSATSVTWNQINDSNPSQILGTLNANGYVVLQNSSGFYVGGQASINTHGLIMTTASTPALNLSSGGPWAFNTPPPTAKIVNYGQINIAGGGSAFLIADDIENNGTISAPDGKIGLFAGQTVLVSTSPDGRGLSAQVTIPQGLVDNNGNLIADAGKIALHAQMVNQNGLIQANSAKAVNGTIELVGSDSVNLGAHSVISASGDTQGTSPGGSVTIKSDNNFSDQAGSVINIAGGMQGGNGGEAEISAPQMSAINSSINGQAVNGFISGVLTIDPYDILLSSSGDNAPASGIVKPGDSPTSGTLTLNVNSFASTLSQITLQAQNNIELNTVWTLTDPGTTATLNLTAGNNITLDDTSAIKAGNNWTLNLNAGNGIYLWGSAYIQAQNGNVSQTPTINLSAVNEVQVGWSGQFGGLGVANGGGGYIATFDGGSINVTTTYGDVNTGTGNPGYTFSQGSLFSPPPYYQPFTASLGGSGISTANGGDVTISAGGNVVSYLPTGAVSANNGADAGTGAFGSKPGNVTINAGGSVFGHYVVANGTGTITVGQDIGNSSQNVALSLIGNVSQIKDGWNLTAQNGDIFLQEVRNPNGTFNNLGSYTKPNYHLFNYAPQAYVYLTADNGGVYLTGQGLPRPTTGGGTGGPVDDMPVILPPILHINAGQGGVVLENNMTLFPSPYQDLQITTTDGGWLNGNGNELLMSDSGQTRWHSKSIGGGEPFGPNDHASVPPELNNDTLVGINIAGNMENLTLQVDRAAQINVAGDMKNCAFYGENLQASGPGSVTSINVVGQIYNAGSFIPVTLSQGFPTLPLDAVPPDFSQGAASTWYAILLAAVDPSKLPAGSVAGMDPTTLTTALRNARLVPTADYPAGYVAYNPNTKTLTAIGPMSAGVAKYLEEPTLTLVRYYPNGQPILNANGDLETETIPWASAADVSLIAGPDGLYTKSQTASPLGGVQTGYFVGGMGQFDVNASSISLGNSMGIISLGSGSLNGVSYSTLAPYLASAGASGATIDVTVKADYQDSLGTHSSLNMASSTIAALAGGDVNVTSTGGSMDLGDQSLLDFETQIMAVNNLALGIYTTGGGNVNVTALGTINVDSSRIATFNGGNINVESYQGDVNAGSGGTVSVPVNFFSPVYLGNEPVEYVPANGIVADTLANASQVPGAATLPGNITVTADQGNIIANLGGISQEAFGQTLSGSGSGGPTITLTANGAPPGEGNIILGTVGVIGVNVVASASGTITGLIISQQNADISAAQSFAGTVFSGGTATLASGGTISGTIVGLGGVNTSGGGNVTATVLSTSVNGGAGTLATSSIATGTSQNAAGQASVENQQQVASNSGEKKKKKKKKKAELVRTVGRVTVILPSAS